MAMMAMMAMRFAGDRLVLKWGAVPMLRTLNALAVVARVAAQRSRRGVGQGIAALAGHLAPAAPAAPADAASVDQAPVQRL